MSSVVTFVLGLIGPILYRAVGALGFTAVTYVGVEASIQALIVSAQGMWGGIPGTVLQLASVGGLPECLGMIFGAYVSVFSAQFAITASKMIFKPAATGPRKGIWSV